MILCAADEKEKTQVITVSPCRRVREWDASEGFVWSHVLVVMLVVGFHGNCSFWGRAYHISKETRTTFTLGSKKHVIPGTTDNVRNAGDS